MVQEVECLLLQVRRLEALSSNPNPTSPHQKNTSPKQMCTHSIPNQTKNTLKDTERRGREDKRE
jgi:hypothetical protein